MVRFLLLPSPAGTSLQFFNKSMAQVRCSTGSAWMSSWTAVIMKATRRWPSIDSMFSNLVLSHSSTSLWILLFVGAQSLNVRSAIFDQNRILFVVKSLLFHDGCHLIGTRRLKTFLANKTLLQTIQHLTFHFTVLWRLFPYLNAKQMDCHPNDQIRWTPHSNVNTNLETEFWNVLTAGFTKHWIKTNIKILLRHSTVQELHIGLRPFQVGKPESKKEI